MRKNLRVAVVAWKIQDIKSDGDFFGHYHDLVTSAHDEGAELIVVPEYHSLELLDLARDIRDKNVPKFLAQFSSEIEEWTKRISDSSGLIIVGGSHIRETTDGFMACSALAVPSQPITLVDKMRLTRYEKTIWRLHAGAAIKLPPTDGIGALICYDIEFPEAARALVDEGVLILANPSFTENQLGFQRVRWCAQARATENQIFVLHSSLTGTLHRQPVPATYGSTAILTPSIAPFPLSGNLGESELNTEGVIVRTIDLGALTACRSKGDVRNFDDRHPYHWPVIKSEPENPIA